MSIAPSNDLADSALAQSKPSFLRRIRIRGYKSIAFCDVMLEPLTILVGRNASGKSNFLDALGFLRDLMNMRVAHAVNERKGWRALHCRAASTPYIEMEVESTFESMGSMWDAAYHFSLEVGAQNRVQAHEEKLSLNQHGTNLKCGFRVVEGGVRWTGIDDFRWLGDLMRRRQQPTAQDTLLLNLLGVQPFIDFAGPIASSQVYNFHPSAIRTLQPADILLPLEADGSNLARAIEGLKEIEPETFNRIGQYLRTIVPGIAGVYAHQISEYETVRFILQAVANQPALEFDAASMSDGTLRILASLVAAFQIVLPTGFPGFIGIEEPETALHPAAMHALVDALDEATLRTQILLTTHSADMLDNPTIQPKNVRVVQMIDGQTVIAPVDAASIEIVARNLNTLGGLERENQLEPDLDDQARQRDLGRQAEESP